MKKAAYLALSILLAAGGFLVGSWYQHGTKQARGGGARKVLYYVDPMHPAYRSDKPGIAPDCGMQLEPVYADGGPGQPGAASSRPAGAVSVAGDKQQLLGIRVGAAEKVPTTHKARLLGRVVVDETRVFVLNSATEGVVREVSGATTGSRVRRGQWLASVFSAESRAPLQAYLTALDVQDQDPATRTAAGVGFTKGVTPSSSAQYTRERLRGVGLSDQQVEEVRRTRQIPLLIKLHAPADGFVVARNVSLDQKFEKGAEFYRLANLDRVWIVADVSADEAPHLRPGTRANVLLPNGQESVTATVSETLPQFDPATRSLKVRLEADNPGYALRPDMLVDVELPLELPAAVTIPVDAVVDTGTRKTVFVERDGYFEPRTIDTGWRFGDRVEVVKGLAAGERFVASGTFLVDSESRLRSAAAGVYGAVAKDVVCGMDVDEAKARAAGKVHDHEGKTYFFCSESCRDGFRSSPGKYLADSATSETGTGAARPAADAKR